jgi:hypothetical protein
VAQPIKHVLVPSVNPTAGFAAKPSGAVARVTATSTLRMRGAYPCFNG